MPKLDRLNPTTEIIEERLLPKERPWRTKSVGKSQVLIFASIFSTALFLSQFNGAFAVPGMGEVGGDPFSVIMILCAPFILADMRKKSIPGSDFRFQTFLIAILASVALSFLFNIINIADASERGRSGLEKFFSSFLVIAAGLYFAYVTFVCCTINIRKYFVAPILLCAALTISVSFVELASWYSSAIQSAYLIFSHVIHAHVGRGQYVVGRIHSITMEPSYFGIFTNFAIPWIFITAADKKTRRRGWWSILLTATIFITFFSGRTALIGNVAIALFCGFLYVMYGSLRFSLKFSRALLILAFAAGILAPTIYFSLCSNAIGEDMVASENLSDVSRFGTIAILLDLFKQNPFFGVGLGQYGFFVNNNVPSWAYNWEFKRWITDENSSFFPSFSVIARIAGEMGGVGLICWFGSMLYFLNEVMIKAHTYSLKYNRIPLIGIAIIAEIFGLLIYGWTAGSLRMINIWCTFGLSLAYMRNSANLEGYRDTKYPNVRA